MSKGLVCVLPLLLVGLLFHVPFAAWLAADSPAPVRAVFLRALGTGRGCTLGEMITAVRREKTYTLTAARIRAGSRLLQRDAGFELWQTPDGRYWIPGGDSDELFGLLAENAGGEYAQPRAGDVVLDCGACIGTTVRPALAAGAGHIIAIEPMPQNVECLRRNLAAEIASGRVTIFAKGVWDREDTLRVHAEQGYSGRSSVVMDTFRTGDGGTMQLTTIDHLVSELRLSRVDFIKMDIEGAERHALLGARETLRRFRPRMALSVYHLPDDPAVIPRIVFSANPAYRSTVGQCRYWSNGGPIKPEIEMFF